MTEENNEKRGSNSKIKQLIIIAVCVFVIAAIVTTVIILLSRRKSVDDILERGDEYMSEKDYESAIREYERAIEIDPESEDAYLKLAEAYIEAGDTEGAIETLEDGYDVTKNRRIRKRLEELTGNNAEDTTDASTSGTTEPPEDEIPVPTKMAIEMLPNKMVYYVGETLDLTGLTLTVTYSDGTTKKISEGYTCDTEMLNEAGFVSVTVRYGDLKIRFEVTVSEPVLEDDFSWTLEGGVLTLSGHGHMPDYNDYDNYAPWYERKDEIKEVVIGDGILDIGECAFYECENLTSITIPNSVTSIGSSAFEECDGFTSITIPNSVTSIEHGAFEGCSNLTSITIPDSVTSIGSCAFMSCEHLSSVTIPGSVTSIGDSAFCGCFFLNSVTISEGVTSIEAWAFEWCYFLESVTIPDSVTSIGKDAFNECYGLTIHGHAGSYAEQYAEDNGIPFAVE